MNLCNHHVMLREYAVKINVNRNIQSRERDRQS